MIRKTKKLLVLFVTFVLVLGTLPVQGYAFAADSSTGENAEEMSGTGGPTGTTGSGSQTPNNEQQVVSGEEDLEEDGNAFEERMVPQGDVVIQNAPSSDPTDDSVINEIIGNMSLEDKIAQMIIPAIRTWAGGNNNVQTLSDYPELANALKAHPYGGIILFGQNVSSVEQTGNLVNALQANNASSSRTGTQSSIPYLMCVDGEGGLVVRFTMGTRMTGSMAIGATGANAEANAFTTGKVLGEEIAALGFTADLAPSVDVNSNPSNPVIGTRSFSDDPAVVGALGVEFSNGLAQSNVVATYKHFPGHGDTSTDSHIGTPAVNKTLEQLEACELLPFRAAIERGTDMIMTAHITLPEYDIEQPFGDGTRGFFPATMSSKVLGDLLRGNLGYDGVVITDALEMDALYEHELVPSGTVGDAGETPEQRRARLKADATYCANLAEKIINAGADILLVPTDLNGANAAAFYDDYVQEIRDKVVGDKSISIARINQSVGRILKLKKKYGILKNYTPVDVERAKAIVGSDEHHEDEMKIAREAITLVKNDDYTLPLSGHENNVVIMGRLKDDSKTIAYALDQLKHDGLLAEDAYINNLAYPDRSSGSESSKIHITIDYYYDLADKKQHYTADLESAIASADKVICFTASYGADALAATSPLYQCVTRAIDQTHAAGGKFVLLSNNLPYDVARYQDVDAAVLGYMAAGLGADPTDKTAGGVAYNANVVAALCSMFDDEAPFGTLPVNIYNVVEKPDLTVDYDMNDVLYERGFGLNYEYKFVRGANGTYAKSSGKDLAFQNNARFDRLDKVLVDGEELSDDEYDASIGSTNILLKASYLDGVAAGEHTLTAVHEYGEYGGTKEVSTNFTVTAPAITTVCTAHCQTYGWDTPSGKDGSTAGTTGESKRLEAIKIEVQGGGIEYRSHVQGKGWEPSWARDGAVSGTTGESKRLEAIQIRLRDDHVNKGYHVWYRVHSQTFGWLGWAKDGEPAGTLNMSKRAEAYEVIVLNEAQTPRDYDAAKAACINNAFGNAHIQRLGWTGGQSSNVFGTTGQALRLEALGLQLAGLPFSGDIEYCLHVQKKGWETEWSKNGAAAGTTGEAKRAEAVRIQLKGEVAKHMSVWYRVHSQTYGWSGWAHDGDPAGTTGLGKRAEAVEVRIQTTGAAAPSGTANALREG